MPDEKPSIKKLIKQAHMLDGKKCLTQTSMHLLDDVAWGIANCRARLEVVEEEVQ